MSRVVIGDIAHEYPPSSILRCSDEKVSISCRNSRSVCGTLRYMKTSGWDNIGTCRMVGKNKVMLTMREEYYDSEVTEILGQMSRVFKHSVLAIWGE